MDFNLVTLEIADLIIHFDYFDNLVSGIIGNTTATNDEQTKIRQKSQEHLLPLFNGMEFYNSEKQLKSLIELKEPITARLQTMKSKDIHDLAEKLEKDVKKIRKLYKALSKNN